MENKNQNRRKFLNKLGAGVAAGAGLALLPNSAMANTDKTNAQTWSMWTHGSTGKIEGSAFDGKSSSAPMSNLIGKIVTLASFTYFRSGNFGGMPGTSVALAGEAAGTMMATSGGGQFIIWDRGTKNNDKNGEFWVHYPIPTPVIAGGTRAKASVCWVVCGSTDIKMHIAEVEVWDGNKRIFSKNDTKLWGPTNTHRFNIPATPSVIYGLCISFKIKGERVNSEKILEIVSVGIDFSV